MKQILIKLGDGRLGYARPGGDVLEGETEQEYLNRIGQETIRKCIRDGQPGWAGSTIVAFVDEQVVLSADRVFRDAWDWTTPNPVMDYDMKKCREIAAKRCGVPQSDPRIASAKTPEELKAAWPEILK